LLLSASHHSTYLNAHSHTKTSILTPSLLFNYAAIVFALIATSLIALSSSTVSKDLFSFTSPPQASFINSIELSILQSLLSHSSKSYRLLHYAFLLFKDIIHILAISLRLNTF
jgi:hypothetical protein